MFMPMISIVTETAKSVLFKNSGIGVAGSTDTWLGVVSESRYKTTLGVEINVFLMGTSFNASAPPAGI
jgi:hypothetical protein